MNKSEQEIEIRDIYFLVPARSGSKGVKYKNIRKIGHRSLLEIAIESTQVCANSNLQTFVSSEDDRILAVAESNNVVAIKRSNQSGSDDATASDVVRDFIGQVLQDTEDYSKAIIVYLQPTSPFRNAQHVKQAISMRRLTEKPIVSVCEVSEHPEKMMYLDSFGFLQSVLPKSLATSNRQSLSPKLIPNGAIYVFSVNEFNLLNDIPITGSHPFHMSREESLDIDTEYDLMVANLVIAQNL